MAGLGIQLNELYQYTQMSDPKPKDPVNFLRGGEQSTIFKLITGHVPPNGHLGRIKKNFSTECLLCRFPNECGLLLHMEPKVGR